MTARHWRDDAACVGTPPEWWETGSTLGRLPERNIRALAVCAGCPVRAACDAGAQTAGPKLRAQVILGGVAYNVHGRARTIDGCDASRWRPGVVHKHRRRPVAAS